MKGHTNNPNGRPKGTPNKVTTDLRGFIKNLLDNNAKQIERDFKALEPKDRLSLTEKLFQYIIPKQQAQQIELSALTDGDLTTIATKVLNQLSDEN